MVFVDAALGRAARAALLDVAGRTLAFVLDFTADLAGPEIALRVVVGFFSLIVDGPVLIRFVAGGKLDFDAGALADALGAIDALLAVSLVTNF